MRHNDKRDVRAVVAMAVFVLVTTALAVLGLSNAEAASPVRPFEASYQTYAWDTLGADIQTWTPTWYEPGYGPETPSEREARRDMVADVIVEASLQGATEMWPADEMALLATIWKFESGRLDYHVHGGDKSPIGRQDGGRSKCLGQIQYVSAWWSKDEWRSLAGRDREATRRCADATLRIVAYHAKRCRLRATREEYMRWRDPLTVVEASLLFEAYATGHSCLSGRRAARAEEWARIRALLL